MKNIVTILFAILISALLSVPAMAQSGAVIFKCSSVMQDYKFLMTVFEDGSQSYNSYFEGASFAGPEKTLRQVLPLSEAIKLAGVTQLISALELSKEDLKTVTEVHVYTSDNFDDDAAGVRGVVFLQASGRILAKGMFFGWAGPMKCLENQN